MAQRDAWERVTGSLPKWDLDHIQILHAEIISAASWHLYCPEDCHFAFDQHRNFCVWLHLVMGDIADSQESAFRVTSKRMVCCMRIGRNNPLDWPNYISSSKPRLF
jgi:hypothetical protein